MILKVAKYESLFVEKKCPARFLPTLPHSNHSSADYPIGTVVTYTCDDDYILAPGAPGSLLRTQTVTCQADGTYTALQFECVCKSFTIFANLNLC